MGRLDLAVDSMAKASTPEPFSTSKTANWVSRVGGLPPFVQHIAHDLIEKRGMDESKAIGMAVGIVKNWAHGHASGAETNVHPDTVAAAQKALKEWESKKAASHALSLPFEIEGGDTQIDEESFRLYLSADLDGWEVPALYLSIIEFDPNKHPRDPLGHFREVLGKLTNPSDPVNEVRMPNGQVFTRGDKPNTVNSHRQQPGWEHVDTVDKAVSKFGKAIEAHPDDQKKPGESRKVGGSMDPEASAQDKGAKAAAGGVADIVKRADARKKELGRDLTPQEFKDVRGESAAGKEADKPRDFKEGDVVKVNKPGHVLHDQIGQIHSPVEGQDSHRVATDFGGGMIVPVENKHLEKDEHLTSMVQNQGKSAEDKWGKAGEAKTAHDNLENPDETKANQADTKAKADAENAQKHGEAEDKQALASLHGKEPKGLDPNNRFGVTDAADYMSEIGNEITDEKVRAEFEKDVAFLHELASGTKADGSPRSVGDRAQEADRVREIGDNLDAWSEEPMFAADLHAFADRIEGKSDRKSE